MVTSLLRERIHLPWLKSPLAIAGGVSSRHAPHFFVERGEGFSEVVIIDTVKKRRFLYRNITADGNTFKTVLRKRPHFNADNAVRDGNNREPVPRKRRMFNGCNAWWDDNTGDLVPRKRKTPNTGDTVWNGHACEISESPLFMPVFLALIGKRPMPNFGD